METQPTAVHTCLYIYIHIHIHIWCPVLLTIGFQARLQRALIPDPGSKISTVSLSGRCNLVWDTLQEANKEAILGPADGDQIQELLTRLQINMEVERGPL